jgi:hypothetical protein
LQFALRKSTVSTKSPYLKFKGITTRDRQTCHKSKSRSKELNCLFHPMENCWKNLSTNCEYHVPPYPGTWTSKASVAAVVCSTRLTISSVSLWPFPGFCLRLFGIVFFFLQPRSIGHYYFVALGRNLIQACKRPLTQNLLLGRE